MRDAAEIEKTLQALEVLDRAGRAELLEFAARETAGHWIDTTQRPSNWDAAHCDIKVHGVTAQAETVEEAVRLWILHARRVLKVAHTVAEAQAVVMHHGPVSDDDMRAACRTIVEQGTSDWTLISTARQTLRALELRP